MTPLDAFRQDIENLFRDYKTDQITCDEAIYEFSLRGDELRQGFISEDIPDEALELIYAEFCNLRMLAYEKGHITQGRALADIQDMAEGTFPKVEVRLARQTSAIAEFAWIAAPEIA